MSHETHARDIRGFLRLTMTSSAVPMADIPTMPTLISRDQAPDCKRVAVNVESGAKVKFADVMSQLYNLPVVPGQAGGGSFQSIKKT